MYSRMCQPISDKFQDLRVITPCIIEARGVNKDDTTGSVARTGNNNKLDCRRARLQVMANGHGFFTDSCIYELLWTEPVEILKKK